ncbi:MAG: hypothetical protein ACREQF_09250 [Candidatus Binataceae bacterium]
MAAKIKAYSVIVCPRVAASRTLSCLAKRLIRILLPQRIIQSGGRYQRLP